MEDTLLLWGFGLLAGAVLLLVLEVFVPSGGVLGVSALLVAIAGLVAFWIEGWIWGVTSTGIVVVLTPMAINFLIKLMPNTPVGKRMFLQEDPELVEARHREEAARREQELALIGAVGVAVNDLYPVGIAEIEGTKIDVLAEGGAIDAGTPVRVTKIEGNQVKVRAI